MPHVIAGAAITLLLIVVALAPRSSAAQRPPATLDGVAVVVRPASPSAEEIGLPTYQEIVAGLPPEPARPGGPPAGAERVRSHELPIWGNRVYSAATTAAPSTRSRRARRRSRPGRPCRSSRRCPCRRVVR